MSSSPPEVEERAGVVVVSPREDVDLATAEALKNSVLGAVPNSTSGVALDLSRVRYVDSAGIRALFILVKSLHERRKALRLVVPSDGAVHRLLDLAQIASVVPIDESVETAVASIQAEA